MPDEVGVQVAEVGTAVVEGVEGEVAVEVDIGEVVADIVVVDVVVVVGIEKEVLLEHHLGTVDVVAAKKKQKKYSKLQRILKQ